MSYDIRFGVKVENGGGLIVAVGSPEYDSPTYNIGTMFRKCTGWDYKQGEWYKVINVLPKIERGIHELRFNEKAYKKYNPDNGWGSTASALECLESIVQGITEYQNGWRQEIPIEYLWIKW